MLNSLLSSHLPTPSTLGHAFPFTLREVWLSLLLASVLLLGLPCRGSLDGADLEDLSRKKAHHGNPGFINPWLPEKQPGGLWNLLKWVFSPNPYSKAKRNPPSFPLTRPQTREILRRGDSITYLGHASFWLHLQGRDIFTDPVFGNVFHLVRHTPFPIPLDELPSPEVVLISHSHYDHLDKESIRRLGTRPLYLTPLGYKDWFAEVVPGARVVELDWFEAFTQRGITCRLLPVQHWSKRGFRDTNRRLWGSWLIQTRDRKVFFSGDSGYFFGFKEYGRKFGPIDAAILPIGCYEPRWFMKDHHMNPEEAVKAFFDLKSRILIPQQWGVFDLTNEPLDLPPRAFREASRAAGLSEEGAPLLHHGETWYFPKN
jgi:N-acyl-phosphatidylethanolamine-hydrolysing phospholipase D